MEYALVDLRARAIAVMTLLALTACQVGNDPGDGGLISGDASSDPTDAGRADGGPLPDSGVRLDDVLIYAHSADTLFEFSPYSNSVTEIGQFTLEDGSPTPQITDLAVDGSGRVFTVSYTSVYVVDTETAVMVPAMDYREDFDSTVDPIFALSFIPPRPVPDRCGDPGRRHQLR